MGGLWNRLLKEGFALYLLPNQHYAMKTTIFRKVIFMACLILTISHCHGTGNITHLNNPSVQGCADSFTYNVVATNYQWNFGADAVPSAIGGANYQTAGVAFLHAGSHRVYVSALTSGGLVNDSIDIQVLANTINITLNANTDSACYGVPITYTAAPSGYQRYDFFVNGNPVQSSTGRTYVANGLNTGDSVYVYAFDGVCYSNPSAVRYPVIKPIPTAPALTRSTGDTICGGQTVSFTASPAEQGTYTFWNGGSQQQVTGSTIWTTYTLGQGNSVYVTLAQNGCTSGWSNIITILVKPTPLVASAYQVICDGQPGYINAFPSGCSFDFVLNGQTMQSGLNSTYSSDTLYTGDVLVVVGSYNGCAATDTISVYPNPLPPTITVSGNTLSAGFGTGFAWYFNSAATPVANTPTYTATQSGSYVVEVFNQYGCGTMSAPVTVQVSDVKEPGDEALLKIIQTDNTSFTVLVKADLTGKTLEVYDVTGRRIFTSRLNQEINAFNCNELSPGIYFLRVEALLQKIVVR
jgi:hypothetical protein